jgi:hypothetical protein
LIQQMTEEEIMEYAGIKVNSSDLVWEWSFSPRSGIWIGSTMNCRHLLEHRKVLPLPKDFDSISSMFVRFDDYRCYRAWNRFFRKRQSRYSQITFQNAESSEEPYPICEIGIGPFENRRKSDVIHCQQITEWTVWRPSGKFWAWRHESLDTWYLGPMLHATGACLHCLDDTTGLSEMQWESGWYAL